MTPWPVTERFQRRNIRRPATAKLDSCGVFAKHSGLIPSAPTRDVIQNGRVQQRRAPHMAFQPPRRGADPCSVFIAINAINFFKASTDSEFVQKRKLPAPRHPRDTMSGKKPGPPPGGSISCKVFSLSRLIAMHGMQGIAARQRFQKNGQRSGEGAENALATASRKCFVIGLILQPGFRSWV